MNSIEEPGFDNWFRDKVDSSRTTDFIIARVISVKNLKNYR